MPKSPKQIRRTTNGWREVMGTSGPPHASSHRFHPYSFNPTSQRCFRHLVVSRQQYPNDLLVEARDSVPCPSTTRRVNNESGDAIVSLESKLPKPTRSNLSNFLRPGRLFRRLHLPFGLSASPQHSSHRIVSVDKNKITANKNPASFRLMTSIDVCPRRLIDTQTLTLVEFSKDDVIPPYAILSHTWCEGEVVYEQFKAPQQNGQLKLKSGYKKIRAACQQARQDGLCYIWIDTCCIIQGNHDDVSANITSMFGYYQNAEVCYAYLEDVCTKSDMFQSSGSKWFDRGWTLQELLAPQTVIFFNKHWKRIGDKHKLQDDICRMTTIPAAICSGEKSIQDVDVLDRMSWSVFRKTTKDQDRAYCLQGLMGVSIIPDYTEPLFESFNRLVKASFDVHPCLQRELGFNDELLGNPYDRTGTLWEHLLIRHLVNQNPTRRSWSLGCTNIKCVGTRACLWAAITGCSLALGLFTVLLLPVLLPLLLVKGLSRLRSRKHRSQIYR
ncbi:hypothetical protein VKT23_017397 [Stygiomarasmius scandens]|uniref:Heterokaryon incompatibility domain-containing protein n=1 Tax=Marasmiellus scandens TaxID=2682957 RepID=A0ABR1IVJ9_9AGAR